MILHVGGTARGTLPAIVDPEDGITPVTPSSLTALVIKNGTDTVDSVTITAVGGGRTGVYKWSYNPAGEVEGDKFSLVFEITISGDPYYYTVDLEVLAVERGTDGAATPSNVYDQIEDWASDNDLFVLIANLPTVAEFEARTLLASSYLTTLGTTAPAGWINAAAIASNAITSEKIADDAIGSSQIAASVVTEIQSGLMLAASYIAPDNAGIAAIKANTDNLPSDPADASVIMLATDTILAAVYTRLAAASYTAPDNAGITAIRTVTDRVNTGLVADGLVWQFTANMLELGPSGGGGGGGGDATLAKQEEILAAIDNYISTVVAGMELDTTTIVGFPSSLNIGDSYTDDMSADIHIFLRDSNDDPVTSVGTHDVTDSDFAPELTIAQDGQVGRVKATVTWVTASPEGYLKVEIPTSQSRRAAPGVAQMQLVLKWDGAEKALTKQAVTWVARV